MTPTFSSTKMDVFTAQRRLAYLEKKAQHQGLSYRLLAEKERLKRLLKGARLRNRRNQKLGVIVTKKPNPKKTFIDKDNLFPGKWFLKGIASQGGGYGPFTSRRRAIAFAKREKIRIGPTGYELIYYPTRSRKSNPHMVKIYDKITRIEGQKGQDSAFPGQKFFHNFKKPYPAMYGTPDRKKLIIQ